MSEPVRRPLPLPSAWKDQKLNNARSAEDLEAIFIESLGQHGTVIKYNRRRLVFPISGLLATIGVMTFIVQAMIPRLISDADYRTIWNGLGLLACATLLIWAVAMLGAILLDAVNGARRDEYIALTAEGIYQEGAGWTAFFPWDEVFNIRALHQSGQRIFLHPTDVNKVYVKDDRRIRMPRMQAKSPPNREIFAGELAVIDVALPYWALKFYHQNPEHRTELGTEAGLRRFRNADFPCDESDDT